MWKIYEEFWKKIYLKKYIYNYFSSFHGHLTSLSIFIYETTQFLLNFSSDFEFHYITTHDAYCCGTNFFLQFVTKFGLDDFILCDLFQAPHWPW